jgi:two-component system, OmpR family, copper resistance phosphate regulon response regulator CusR
MFYQEGRVRILVVEDEPKVAAAIQQGLESESYSVSIDNNGEEGFFLASSERFDLIILDIMLPGRSGIEILSAMRERGIPVPVVLLTAKDAVEDVEYATLEWVDWFNNRRLLEPIGNVPPAEF